MKNVLFLTYCFPPYADSGVFRPLKFVKYLKKHKKWNPIVVTLNIRNYPNKPIDDSLNDDVPENMEIHYVNSLEPLDNASQQSKDFFYEIQTPERAIGSLMHFLIKSLEIINTQKIDLIFCTIPPYTLGIVGKVLKEITNIPLVVDYRDGWTTGNEINKYRSIEGKMLNTYFESEMLKSVDGIVTVDKKLGDIILENTSNIPLSIIPNGYDMDDINKTNGLNVRKINAKKYRIVYCGFTYTAYEVYIRKILRAIERLVNQNIELEFIIAGDMQNPNFSIELQEYNFVNYLGRVSFTESLNLVSSADINLAVDILSTSAGSKFYNLLLANRYIFSLVNKENEFIHDFIENYPYKTILPLEASEEEISEDIKTILELDRTDLYLKNDEVLVKYKEYDREYNTIKLENFFNQVLYTSKFEDN